jgi:recombination protein RecT
MTTLSIVDSVLTQAMPQFRRIADANKLVRWEEESQFAMQALQGNSGLLKCTPESIQNSIINVAAVGLTLCPADGYAYLIPEYNKSNKSNECKLRISFKGLIKAATDTGSVIWVRAEIVKEADTFVYNGVDEKPTHKMEPFGVRGDPVGVYCVAKVADNEYLTDVMDWAEVTKIRGSAQTDSVWRSWPEEMAKKAIIKRAAKQWPKSQKSGSLHKAIEVINDTEGGTDPMADVERVADEILQLIVAEDYMGVGQLWVEQDEKSQSTLWTAKTKGGWFSMDEKAFIRKASDGYRKACAEDVA